MFTPLITFLDTTDLFALVPIVEKRGYEISWVDETGDEVLTLVPKDTDVPAYYDLEYEDTVGLIFGNSRLVKITEEDRFNIKCL